MVKNLTFVALIVVMFAVVSAFVSKTNSTGPQLKITNKTDSRIDEVHIGGSGDILDADEVLEPGETVTVNFSGCEGHENMAVEILLIFKSGGEFSFEDTVCDGDFAWDIVNDGDHSN